MTRTIKLLMGLFIIIGLIGIYVQIKTNESNRALSDLIKHSDNDIDTYYTHKDYEDYCRTFYNKEESFAYTFVGFNGKQIICEPLYLPGTKIRYHRMKKYRWDEVVEESDSAEEVAN